MKKYTKGIWFDNEMKGLLKDQKIENEQINNG